MTMHPDDLILITSLVGGVLLLLMGLFALFITAILAIKFVFAATCLFFEMLAFMVCLPAMLAGAIYKWYRSDCRGSKYPSNKRNWH